MSIRDGGIRLLAVCATLGGLAAILPASRAQTTLSAFVSSSLPPAEHDYVAFQVSHLPQHLQDMLAASDPKQVHLTFIDGRTGAIHHNRPEDAGSITEADVTELPGDPACGRLRPADTTRA